MPPSDQQRPSKATPVCRHGAPIADGCDACPSLPRPGSAPTVGELSAHLIAVSGALFDVGDVPVHDDDYAKSIRALTEMRNHYREIAALNKSEAVDVIERIRRVFNNQLTSRHQKAEHIMTILDSTKIGTGPCASKTPDACPEGDDGSNGGEHTSHASRGAEPGRQRDTGDGGERPALFDASPRCAQYWDKPDQRCVLEPHDGPGHRYEIPAVVLSLSAPKWTEAEARAYGGGSAPKASASWPRSCTPGLEVSKTCCWYDEDYEDTDPTPMPATCSGPATHYSCCYALSPCLNVCEKHRCRCKQPGRERAPQSSAAIAGAHDEIVESLHEEIEQLRREVESLGGPKWCASCPARGNEPHKLSCPSHGRVVLPASAEPDGTLRVALPEAHNAFAFDLVAEMIDAIAPDGMSCLVCGCIHQPSDGDSSCVVSQLIRQRREMARTSGAGRDDGSNGLTSPVAGANTTPAGGPGEAGTTLEAPNAVQAKSCGCWPTHEPYCHVGGLAVPPSQQEMVAARIREKMLVVTRWKALIGYVRGFAWYQRGNGLWDHSRLTMEETDRLHAMLLACEEETP